MRVLNFPASSSCRPLLRILHSPARNPFNPPHLQVSLDRDRNHVVTYYLILSNHARHASPQATSLRDLCVLRVSALDSSSLGLTLNLQSEVRRLSRPEIPARSGLSTFNCVSFLSPSSPHLCVLCGENSSFSCPRELLGASDSSSLGLTLNLQLSTFNRVFSPSSAHLYALCALCVENSLSFRSSLIP